MLLVFAARRFACSPTEIVNVEKFFSNILTGL
jgi:hypothetical protein